MKTRIAILVFIITICGCDRESGTGASLPWWVGTGGDPVKYQHCNPMKNDDCQLNQKITQWPNVKEMAE